MPEVASLPTSGGEPVDHGARQSLEAKFGSDLGDVRVHARGDGAAKTDALGARAITSGRNIYFAPGQYQPQSSTGYGLLAHEMTHVLQQRAGRFPLPESHPSPAAERVKLEREAHAAQAGVTGGSSGTGHASAHHPGAHAAQFGLKDEAIKWTIQQLGGFLQIAEYVLKQVRGTKDAILAALIDVYDWAVAQGTHVMLSDEVIADCERLYNVLKATMPDFIPVPKLDFRSGTVQFAAQAIPIALIVVFLLIVIIWYWLMLRANPTTRRQQDEAIRDLIEKLTQPQTRPQEKPKEAPKQDPKPDPKPPEKTTDVFPPLDPKPKPGKPLMWREPVNYDVTTATGGLAGALDFRFLKAGHYSFNVPLNGKNYNVDATGMMAWHAHHPWPKFVGGAPGQTLMTVRGALHISILHPALLEYLRSGLGHDITGHETDPKNQKFIVRLKTDAPFRARVMREMQTFYVLVNAITDPVTPQAAYNKGIADTEKELAKP